MSAHSIAKVAVRSFETYTEDTPTKDMWTPGGLTCFADFVYVWLRSGKGVRACQFNWETFLIALHGLIDNWMSDPKVTDYVEGRSEEDEGNGPIIVTRLVDSIFGESGLEHRILDPHFFAQCVFTELHGKEGEQRPL